MYPRTHRSFGATRRTLLALAFSLTVTVGLSACSGSTTTGTQSASDSSRTITHAMGSTSITGTPTRVIALEQSYVDSTLALESPIIGLTEYGSIGAKLPEYLGEDRTNYAGSAVSVGSLAEPDLEKIAELKPDLIVSTKIRHEKIYDQLSKIAPTIMTEDPGADWKKDIRTLGTALGKDQLAEKKISDFEVEAKRVGSKIKEKIGDVTVSIVRFMDGPTRIYQNGSFAGAVLKNDVGLRRPAVQDSDKFMTEISEESIPKADADKIFAAIGPANNNRNIARSRETFERNPLWAPLAPKVVNVQQEPWIFSVSLQGAHQILKDLSSAFGV